MLCTYFDRYLTFYLARSMKFMKYLLPRVSYAKNTPPPANPSETLFIRMCVHVILLPLIQPFKKLQETISSSTRIYKQSLLNSLQKETDRYADAQTPKKKKKNLKIEQHCPIDQKLVKRVFPT